MGLSDSEIFKGLFGPVAILGFGFNLVYIMMLHINYPFSENRPYCLEWTIEMSLGVGTTGA